MRSITPSQITFNDDGLVPAIAQDASTGQVLMMAWMNRESLEMTCASGRATYWSRSRQELWCKGDTSGHVQYVREIRVDCDADTVLLVVDQTGAACHTGSRSCFDVATLPLSQSAGAGREQENHV